MRGQSEIRQQNRQAKCQLNTTNSDEIRIPKCLKTAQPFFAEGTVEPVADEPTKFRIKSNVLLPHNQQLHVDIEFMANIRDIVASTSSFAIGAAVQQQISPPSVSSHSATSSLPNIPFLRSHSQSPTKQPELVSNLLLKPRLAQSLTDGTLASTSHSVNLSRRSSRSPSRTLTTNTSTSEQVKIGGSIPRDAENSVSKDSQDSKNMILLERHRLWGRHNDLGSVDSSSAQSPALSGDVFLQKSSDSDMFPESGALVPDSSSSALPESSATATGSSESSASANAPFETNSENETENDLRSSLKRFLERDEIDTSRKAQPKNGSKKRLPSCTAKNCNLSIPPSIIGRKLKDERYTGSMCRTETKVMLAGVIESLVCNLLDIAGQNAKACGEDCIEPVHITRAVVEDKDFYRLFRNVDIPIDPPDN